MSSTSSYSPLTKKGEAINPLKTKRRLLYLKTQSEGAVKTFHLGY